MNKLLSQEEVDSLLQGLDTGEVDVDQDFDEIEKDVESFDWATTGLNVRGNMPLLEVVNSRFSQKFRGTISSSLRKMIDVTPEPLETIKYMDFQRSLPVPTSMHLFRIDPLRGMGILVIESRLVFSLVEAYFGGSGVGTTKIEERDFTAIENRVIEKIVHMALGNLIEAWEEVHPIRTEFIRSESNPLVVNIVPGEELLISTKYELELNKSLGKIIICVPYTSYQPIRHKLIGGYSEEDEIQLDQKWVDEIREQLLGVSLGLTIDLGHTHITVRDFLNLREGDIIVLDKESNEPIIAKSKTIPLYQGYAGQYRSKKVFKVDRPFTTRP